MKINGTQNCFITLKDHKDNFLNNPSVRLINPAKNEMGRISKTILDNINNAVKHTLQLNQWKNTSNVIEWFKQIANKDKCKFLIFDVCDFYQSIKENLLKEALQFAEQHTNISQKDKEIIHHSRKSLLFNSNDIWMKKDGLFDVTMGAYDGAEVCELVGNFMLFLISKIYNKNDIGLYRDDGLAVFENLSGPQSERIKKSFTKLFNKYKLKITVQCNIKIVNYLDVSLNLTNATYHPYHKSNNEINYIHKESNHPPSIIKQLPLSIESRLSSISSNQKVFQESIPVYEEALIKSGYNHELKYKTSVKTNRRVKNRKRKVIWFNPPYSRNVATKVGKYFSNLIDKHFPKTHKLHRIFNRNTIKISYSSMPNVKSIIDSHNHRLLHQKNDNNERLCNCINKQNCPLHQKCLSSNILYKATITSNLNEYGEKVYIGISETRFKLRHANHKKSFKFRKYESDTELSKEVWKINNLNGKFDIKWDILRQCPPYKADHKKCLLCLNEKLEIATYGNNNLINRRNEVIGKCRHQNKVMLLRFDSKD